MIRAGMRVGVVGLCFGLVLAGCGEEEKPPAPPPKPVAPPPPPPPEPVDAQALLQDLGADARVQFPQENAPADRDLAEGAIRLADAIARGDEQALREQLDDRAEAVLDELVAGGQWYEDTSSVEAVRIVYVSGAAGQSASEAADRTPADEAETLEEQMDALIDEAVQAAEDAYDTEIPEAQVEWIRSMMRQQMQQVEDAEALSPEMLDQVREIMLARINQQTQSAGSSFNAHATLGNPADMQADIVLAVQDDAGAYLLGWRREGGAFTNTEVSSGVRRFARDWDDATLAELAPRPMVTLAADNPLLGGSDGLDGEPGDAGDEADRDRRTKQTPRGPVDIPSSPGGS